MLIYASSITFFRIEIKQKAKFWSSYSICFYVKLFILKTYRFMGFSYKKKASGIKKFFDLEN